MKKKCKRKSLIIISMLVCLMILGLVTIIRAKNRAGEYLKYENWRSGTMEKVVQFCDMDLDEVDKISITIYNPTEKGIGYFEHNEENKSIEYIIDDEEVIKEVISNIKDIKVYGAKENIEEIECNGSEWSIKFYVNNMEYCFNMTASGVDNTDDVEVLWMSTDYARQTLLEGDFPDPSDYLWSFKSLIYNEKLIEQVYDICKSYIKNITIKDIMNIYDGENAEKFFAYENDGGQMKEGYVMFSDEIYSLVYIFPIEDFDGYVSLERQNECFDDKEGGEAPVFYTDIIDVKIYNNDGESIDFLKTTKGELEEFLK